jgi:hypothetical protein
VTACAYAADLHEDMEEAIEKLVFQGSEKRK